MEKLCFKSFFQFFPFLISFSVFFSVVALIDKFARYYGSRRDKNLQMRTYMYVGWRIDAMLHCSKLSRATRDAPTRRRAVAYRRRTSLEGRRKTNEMTGLISKWGFAVEKAGVWRGRARVKNAREYSIFSW